MEYWPVISPGISSDSPTSGIKAFILFDEGAGVDPGDPYAQCLKILGEDVTSLYLRILKHWLVVSLGAFLDSPTSGIKAFDFTIQG
jgi:hypothetical protein